ncbi:MAG: hypothetical protein K0R66_1180 [Gammaproteobacteria bacterium]|jgi:hypothetical protein|nr:hypothetical protein [Gammaproteobacteria bacterium]
MNRTEFVAANLPNKAKYCNQLVKQFNTNKLQEQDISKALANIAENFIDHGIDKFQIESIMEGLSGNGWEKAVNVFSKSKGLNFNLFLGPMRAMEGKPLQLGFLFLEKHPLYPDIVKKVEDHVEEIGECIFGQPCSFHNRHVEYYNIISGAGPFINANGEYIALFTPFYIGNIKLTAEWLPLRRSIIFHNLIQARFEILSMSCAEKGLRINGKLPLFLTCTREQIEQAIILWLTLHELFHGSGPLPLFDSSVPKLKLGRKYSGIEEMRVDMTVWLALSKCRELFGELAAIAQHIILAERLIRSPSSNFDPAKRIVDSYSSDSENGMLWLSALAKNTCISFSNEKIDIDTVKTEAVLINLLNDIYQMESFAANKTEKEIAAILIQAATQLRNDLCMGDNNFMQFSPELKKYQEYIFELPKRLTVNFI